jgi:uncharacterized protein YecA (UPF0149 family)
MDLKNMDVDSILPMLTQFGINPEQLGEDKLKKIMKLSEEIKDPQNITPKLAKSIMKTLGISKKKLNNIKNGNTESVREPKKSTKIGRNELCKCNSGKKYKKCCWEK